MLKGLPKSSLSVEVMQDRGTKMKAHLDEEKRKKEEHKRASYPQGTE